MRYTDAEVTASFNRAASVVKAWGKASLADGRSLEEVLTVRGISLWTAISPMLCVSHVSKLLNHPRKENNIKQVALLIARKFKYALRDLALPLVSNAKGCADWPAQPSFVFLGFSYYIYRETLQSVALRIAGRAGYSAVVLNDDPVYSRSGSSAAGNEVVQSLLQHWNVHVSEEVRAMRHVYQESMGHVSRGVRKIVESTDIPWKGARPILNWLFRLYIPQLILTAAVAKHIIEKHRPLLLLSPDVNDPRVRVFCLAGKPVGIQTLEVQHGSYTEDCSEWQFFIADHLAVTGEKNLQIMQYHGIPKEKMTVTGSPRFDIDRSFHRA